MPTRPTRNVVIGIVAAALHAPGAYADGPAAPMFSFSGYGTLGVVHSSQDRADYLLDAFKPTGPGFTRDWSADVDSRLGAQVSAQLTPHLSGVVQVVVQQRYDDSYTPVLEWANLKYRWTPDLSVRAGRVVLPIFMATDHRKVGYANPWVRPPVEVYSLVPLTTNDGVDASWQLAFGEYTNALQFAGGGSDSKFPPGLGTEIVTARVRDLIAVVDTLERGFASVRVSYGRSRLTIGAFDPLFDAFAQFGLPGIAIADKYSVKNRRVDFVGLGASYDPGPWFAMAEFAKFDTRSVVGAKSAWYASGGLRVGKVTPYATYARMKPDNETSDPGLPLTGLPPPLAGSAAGLNANLNALLANNPDQKTYSIGARWDFLKNAALKVQYDRVMPAAYSAGTFGNTQPGFQPGTRANLFSIAVDFVF